MNNYFISGIPTSGTTLLANLLGYHSKLSPVYETDFVLQWLSMFYRKKKFAPEKYLEVMDKWSEPLPHRPDSKKDYETYPFGAHHILFNRDEAMDATHIMIEEMENGYDKAIAEAIEKMFACHAQKDEKEQWINKTPMYLLMLDQLKETFDDMKVINCVRDGRDVTWTILDRPFGPDEPEQGPKWWTAQAMKGRKFKREHPDSYLEVKYEDMITDTSAVVDKCIEFLGYKSEGEQIVDEYPVDIYSSRIGIYKDKPELCFDGKKKQWLNRLGYS